MADVAALKNHKPQSTAAPAVAHSSASEPTRSHTQPRADVQNSSDESPPATARVFAMLTHRGQHRHINQDACAARPELGVFVVCDGMGGAAAGEVASQLACDTFLDCIVQRCCPPSDDPAPSAVPAHAPHSAHPRPRTRLADAVRAANHAVYRHSRKSPSLHGMGTTLVALLWENSVLRREGDPPTPPIWLAHVGDSRCYRLRAGVLQQLTEDHSLVEEQVRAGVLSHLQANASPMRNIITRAIGSHATVEAAIATHATQPGDLYLLASDGLSCELDDAEIAAILTRMASPAALDAARAASDLALQTALDDACHALVDAANAHGGRDNITVLLVPCP